LNVSQHYPKEAWELVWMGVIYLIVIAWTWDEAHKRRLPWWHALYGLFFLTGTVYVMTLPGRNDPEGLWRSRTTQAFRKSRNRLLLGFLTLYMTGLLVMGAAALLTSPFVGTSWVHWHLDGGEAESFREVLPMLPGFLYMAFLGVFHYAVTRRRVKELQKQ
jgi:hypothetical protein